MNNFVVVTGSSGFIAGHLVKHLHRLGLRVLCIDLRPPTLPLPPDSRFEQADLGDPAWRYVGESPDVLYHLAAEPWSMIKGKSWFEGSKSSFYSNAAATYNVLNQMNPKHIVFSSTANLYGEGRQKNEDSPIRVTSQYGYSKWIAEEIIRKSGIPYTIFRFGTVVGPRGRTFPNRLAWSAVNGIKVDLFYGGLSRRSLIDVEDIVLTLSQGTELNALTDNTYNISSKIEVTTIELAQLVDQEAKKRGLKLEYNPVDFSAPGYVKESTLDCSRIRDLYGWTTYIPQETTVNRLLDYYQTVDALEPPSWDKI